MKPRMIKCKYDGWICSSTKISTTGTVTTLQGFGRTPKDSYRDWVFNIEGFDYWVATGKYRRNES